MWPMIAEPNLRCTECRHSIQPGRLCLSALPEETPPGVSRGDFKNYCIGCPECWKQGKHACYVRHLENEGNSAKTPRSLPCARCGRRIGAGEKAAVEVYYEWPENTSREHTGNWPSPAWASVAATGIDLLARGIPSGSFPDLTASLQAKFRYAGLGGERGVRSMAEAQTFYQQSVPTPVRNLGPDAVQRFLDGKDASHIRSVHNAPDLAKHPDNLLWWDSAANRAHGPENMSGTQQLYARSTNALHASEIVFRDCLQAAGAAALYAALLETPVATIENYIHYRKGRKSGEKATRDAAASIAKTAGTGFAVGFAVTLAAAAVPGTAVLLTTFAPVIMPVGIVLYGCSDLKRVLRTLDEGLPLDMAGTYFCSPRCHARFAWETGWSALIRWEDSRSAVRP